MNLLRKSLPPLLLACLLLNSGCSSKKGPEKFIVSGTVTMADGSPTPAGEIMFEPDGSAGNKGPGSMAELTDGKYSLTRDQGIIGGKYIVNIIPFDGKANPESPKGMPLMRAPYTEKIDLPAEDSTKDFKLPK